MNGVQYTQGQKWNDGCDKMCVCDDGITGHYTCSDRYDLHCILRLPLFDASLFENAQYPGARDPGSNPTGDQNLFNSKHILS